MVEATEIAKLRLFLKMVAVVDVNPRDPNLGLDPLPDIDFNIRCGNTLVGYATEKEMEEGVKYMDMFVRQEFETQVYDEIDIVSTAYNTFRKVQLEQNADLETFKNAKAQLKERLAKLNELLNQNLHAATAPGMDYEKWKKSHQPFHWLAEFYEIIKGNSGFDVIIGNPPYVKITANSSNLDYVPTNITASENCGDLYGYCLERISFLTEKRFGVIIPLSLTATNKMEKLKKHIIKSSKDLWTSYYSASAQPCTLFEGVRHRLMIIISNMGKTGCNVYTSNFMKWLTVERSVLFSGKLHYIQSEELGCCKIASTEEYSILKRIMRDKELAYYIKTTGSPVYYHNAPVYWGKVFNFVPMFKIGNQSPIQSSHLKTLYFDTVDFANIVICILNSSLFYWFNWQYSNCRDLAVHNIEIFNFSLSEPNHTYYDSVKRLCDSLMKDYRDNSVVYRRVSNGILTQFDSFYPAKSKDILDEIDKLLASHYGFTEEELDFIINYDIKYRMGDELDNNE